MGSGFQTAWGELDPARRRVLELAYASLAGGGLAVGRTRRDLGDCVLVSTQEPCSMCAAAASFLGVGTVRYVAPDPWALASGQPQNAAAVGPAPDLWVVIANLMFLLGIASRAGVEHPTVVANRDLEPETTRIVLDMVSDGLAVPAVTNRRSLTDLLTKQWPRITAAATDRGARTTARNR